MIRFYTIAYNAALILAKKTQLPLLSDEIVVGRCEMVQDIDVSDEKTMHFAQLYYNKFLSNS